jgi:LuxR family transcriptional regulator, maltose regulon positive regulatory protein
LHAACFLSSAVVLARIRQTQGRSAEALAITEMLLSFGHETSSEVVLSGARAFQAELALCQGRLTEAGQWAAQYGSFRRVPTPFALVPPLVLGLVLLQQCTPASRQQAHQLLAQMDDYFTSIHYTVIRIQVLALQALLYSVEGDEPQALAALSSSIALAAPGGFLRLFVDLGKPLKPLLRKLAQNLAQRGVSPTYINEILAAFGPGEASPGARQSLSTAPVSIPPGSSLLTTRELEVLELLDKRYSDKEIADTLSISVDTVRSHVQHLSEKLEAHGRRAIVEAATQQGLLQSES